MKTLILLFFISGPLFAVDKKIVLEQLMGIHGPNWSAVAQDESDYREIKETLYQVISGELDFADYGYTGDATTEIVQSATSEYGNFVALDSNGKIIQQDRELIEKLKSDINSEWTSHDALAYYELLKNSGSAEGLDLLSENLLETENLSTLYTIGRSLHHGLQGEENQKKPQDLDHSYISYYRPNLKNNWKKRRGDWKAVLKKINQRIKIAEDIVKQRSQDKNFLNAFGKLRSDIIELSKEDSEEKRQVLIQKEIDTSNGDKVLKKDSRREISGIEEEEEKQAQNNYLWPFILFAFILFFLIRAVTRR